MTDLAGKLARYRSHKLVEAGEILEVIAPDRLGAPGTLIVRKVDGGTVGVEMSVELYRRGGHIPQVGDRLMLYPDGYLSISPKAAFEDGYTLVEAPP